VAHRGRHAATVPFKAGDDHGAFSFVEEGAIANWSPAHGTQAWEGSTKPFCRFPTAYRMLAGLPGIRSVGRGTDPLGRPGMAVARTEHDQGVRHDRAAARVRSRH
jgi:hypothetical protein